MGFNESTMTFESIYNYSFDSKDSHVNVHLDDDLVPVSVSYIKQVPHEIVTVTPVENGFVLESASRQLIINGLDSYSLSDRIREMSLREEAVTAPFDQDLWEDRDFTAEASEQIQGGQHD